jgi:hypothetical protein
LWFQQDQEHNCAHLAGVPATQSGGVRMWFLSADVEEPQRRWKEFEASLIWAKANKETRDILNW